MSLGALSPYPLVWAGSCRAGSIHPIFTVVTGLALAVRIRRARGATEVAACRQGRDKGVGLDTFVIIVTLSSLKISI